MACRPEIDSLPEACPPAEADVLLCGKRMTLNLRTTMMRSAASFVDAWPQILALRTECSAEDDVLLDPLHFLATTSQQRRSCSVACWDGEQLVGLVFATEHWVRGISTGYAIAGDFSGRGLLLSKPEHENAVLEAAAECIFAHGIHSLHLRHAPRSADRPDFPNLRVKYLDALIPGDRLTLGVDYEAFLGTLGRHTRRNVRNFTRKALDASIRFDPLLSADEFLRERERLNAKTFFPAEPSHLERDDRLLALHNDGHRMGLRAADGSLVALVCGFTRDHRFHLLTQWNDSDLEKLSLSMVLRGYLVEHLIASGHQELQFMGGSSLSFGRFCPPHQYCSILLDRSTGLTLLGKRLLAPFCLRRARAGKPLPYSIESLSGGFLDESRIALRTALYPASVAFAGRGKQEDVQRKAEQEAAEKA